MDQIYTNMILMTQAVMRNSAPAGTERGEESSESFRELLERHQGSEQTYATEAETESTEPAEGAASGEDHTDVADDSIMREQMVAATLAAMQKPVVEMTVCEMATQVGNAATEPVVMAMENGGPVVAQETTNTLSMVQTDTKDTSVTNAETPELQQMESEVSMDTDSNPIEKKRESIEQPELDVSENVQEGDVESPVFREVKEVMVKVGDVSSAESANQVTSVEEQLGKPISEALDRGESRITVQLNPQNLGRVDVEMTVAKDGSLQVTLHAENRMTQHLLEKESGGLQAALMRSTQQEVQVEVPRQQESQQHDFEDGRQNGRHHNPQQEQKEQKGSGSDFLHQLRLGLVPLNEEAS